MSFSATSVVLREIILKGFYNPGVLCVEFSRRERKGAEVNNLPQIKVKE